MTDAERALLVSLTYGLVAQLRAIKPVDANGAADLLAKMADFVEREGAKRASEPSPTGQHASVPPALSYEAWEAAERDAFETWYRAEQAIPNWVGQRGSCGDYWTQNAEMCWRAWLARASRGNKP